jgi:8-oxo-dGTP pyrophosphatase MutT (NUDIX family)
MRNSLSRQIWRLGYWALWLSSFVVKRRGRGAKCALFNDGQVLLVRHTYGPKEWELPGGGLRRGEDPFAGVQREVREELGVEIESATELGVGSGLGRFADARISYFAADLPSRDVVADPVEIAEVAWFDPVSPPAPLGSHAAAVIARHGEAIASPRRPTGESREGLRGRASADPLT